MNNKRRKEINNAIILIEQARHMLELVLTDEESAYENMPENLQNSLKGETSEEAIDVLNEVIDALSNIIL